MAEKYHAKFGGADNPQWADIAAMGQSMSPGAALYGATAVGVAGSAAAAHAGNLTGDSTSLGETALGKDYETASLENDIFDLSGDQSGLMDQSLDPAFAFDEGDLEATGDFSKIASELAQEESAGIDFPGFDDAGTAANESLQTDDSLNTRANQLERELDRNELEGLPESVDDLTLDLEQLSGDLEIENSDLMNPDLSDLEIPELSADDELLLDSTGAIGEGGDEMDTMMDLAKAYIDMGDKDSASSALGEIVKSGSPAQVTEAETLLRRIS